MLQTEYQVPQRPGKKSENLSEVASGDLGFIVITALLSCV